MTPSILLKDQLFNRSTVSQLAEDIDRVYPAFLKDKFISDVMAEFPRLELKERITWIATVLGQSLPKDVPTAVKIVVDALPPACNPDLSDQDFGLFIYAASSAYVKQVTCNPVHIELGLTALYAITQRFSAEYAIRAFINQFPTETIRSLNMWVNDGHYHVRRLVSEGTRPRLPWAEKLNLDPFFAIPLIETLLGDPTRYVTRSVANHINDLSKIDADRTIDWIDTWSHCVGWQAQSDAERRYILKHGLRTLIKQGNPRAFRHLGYTVDTEIHSVNVHAPQSCKIGESIDLSLTAKGNPTDHWVIDYAIFYHTASGRISRKVLKWTIIEVPPSGHVTLNKQIKFVSGSTRTIVAGDHKIECLINGKSMATVMICLHD